MMGLGAMGGLGMFIGIIFWVGLVVVILAGLFTLFSGHTRRGNQTPLQILRERFARGEISLAEYEMAKQALGGSPVDGQGWPEAK